MKNALFASAAALALWAPVASSSAFADEVVVHPGVVVPTPGVVVKEKDRDRDRGCETKTVHKEDDEGDSKTVKKTDCD